MEQQYKKYSQLIQGQFKKTSKKAQALFVGRAYQTLRACVEEKKDELKMRLDTLRFIVQEVPLEDDEGVIEPNWIRIVVAYEVGSYTPYTEEDRKAAEERKRQAEERKKHEEEQYGLPAMEAMEREVAGLYLVPPTEDQIQ